MRDGSHIQQGQDRELYPILALTGEVLHCSAPPIPERPQPQKRMRETEEQKRGLERGWCGRFKNKKRTYHWMRNFCLSCFALPSFHSTPHHWTTIIPSHGFPHLKFGYYGRYYGTVYTVRRQGNHYTLIAFCLISVFLLSLLLGV